MSKDNITVKTSETSLNHPTIMVTATASDGESLKAQVADLRKGFIGKINTEQQKINSASGRVDAFFLRIGRHVSEFLAAAKAKGETREDYLYKSIVKDPTCKVRKGALYNATTYFKTHQEMEEKFGKAPDVPMTLYVKCRHKAFSIEEKHELLLKAEADHDVTASKLNALVAEKLKEKGFGRKPPTPEAELTAYCQKVLVSMTKVAGLIKKGVTLSSETVFTLGKTVEMAITCNKAAVKANGNAGNQSIPTIGEASLERKAS